MSSVFPDEWRREVTAWHRRQMFGALACFDIRGFRRRRYMLRQLRRIQEQRRAS